MATNLLIVISATNAYQATPAKPKNELPPDTKELSLAIIWALKYRITYHPAHFCMFFAISLETKTITRRKAYNTIFANLFLFELRFSHIHADKPTCCS